MAEDAPNSTPPKDTPSQSDGAGGRGSARAWKIATFVLLALLLLSGGANLGQLGARGAIASEAAITQEQLSDATARADAAEQEAAALHLVVGDLDAQLSALQVSLGRMLASTGDALASHEARLATAEDVATDLPDVAAFE